MNGRHWLLRMTVLRAAAIVGVLVASGATAVDAQTVQGRVYDASTDRRIPSALIRLVDRSGEDRVAFAADSTGRFSITVPGAGSYRLQADHLGYDTFESDPFDLMNLTTTITVDVSMRPLRFRSGGSRCPPIRRIVASVTSWA